MRFQDFQLLLVAFLFTSKVKRKILVNKDLLALIGFYIAEGSLNNGYRVRFHFGPLDYGREEKNVKEVVDSIKRIFGVKAVVRKTKTGTNVEIDSYPVWFFFAEVLGFKNTSSLTKEIPSVVFNTSSENQKAFLRALFLGDGSLNKGNITFNTISFKLASSTLYLLLQHRITASYSTSNPKFSEFDKIKSKHKVHKVTICSKPDLFFVKEIWEDHWNADVLRSYLNGPYKGYKRGV